MTLHRWLSAVVPTACALVLSGGVHAVASAPTVSLASAEPSSPSSFSVVTYNIRHGLSDAAAVADVQRLADKGVDVIGLQEMGSWERRSAVRARVVDCDTCPYNTYMPTGSGPAEIPILYRSSIFELVSKGNVKVSDATYVGPDGAGPSTIAPKYLTYVQLRHKVTAQEFYLINNHTVASVQASDGGPNYKNRERLRLYRQHMDGLKAMITEFKATGAGVFTTGDFNVNYRRDVVVRDPLFPYYNMKQVDVFASYKDLGIPDRGTHVAENGSDGRIIDYVSALDHPAFAPKAQEILMGYNSDHRPVWARYAIAGPPGSPTGVVAEPLERAARVSWGAAPDNGRRVTSYTVTAVQDGTEVTVPGDTTTATVSGLTEGTGYTFVVRATNLLGPGSESIESNEVIPYAVPPRTRITSGPAPGSFVTSSRADFGYASNVPGSTYSCFLDNAEVSCDPSSVVLRGLSKDTHEFSVTARDGAGDVDPTPATRSWTVPLSSTDLTRSTGWSQGTGSGYYTGSYLHTTRQGAVLRRQVSDATSLALVATKGPGYGRVQVFLGSTLLTRLSLEAGTVTKRRILPIAEFTSAQSGRVRIVVTSTGKPVRVEGLGVATSQ